MRAQDRQNPLTLALLLLGLLMATAVQGQNLLTNGGFDSDVDGWVYFGGPETFLRWDGDRGMPNRGSLQLSSKQDIVGRNPLFEAMSGECFPVTAGEIIRVEALVLANPGVGVCFVEVVFFKGPECSGSRSFSGNVPPNTPGVWEPRTFTIDVGTTARTARVALALFRSSGSHGLTTCNFDSVSLTRGPERGAPVPEDIPTLSAAGLLALIPLIAFGAVAALRRGRPAGVRSYP